MEKKGAKDQWLSNSGFSATHRALIQKQKDSESVQRPIHGCPVKREKNFFKEKPLYRRFVIHEPRINTSGVEDMPAS
jgi:hypothetical protein